MRASVVLTACLVAAAASAQQVIVTNVNEAQVRPQLPCPTVRALTPTQASRVSSDHAAYVTSMEAQPEHASFVAAFATQTMEVKDFLAMFQYTDAAEFSGRLTHPSDWVTELPTAQQAYYSSVKGAMASIIGKDASSGAAGQSLRETWGVMVVVAAALLAPGLVNLL